MITAKYIRAKGNSIIVFSAALKHSEFKHFNPVSAGFVDFGVDRDGKMETWCYGKSESLGLQNHEDDDKLVRMQILNTRY